MVINGIADDHGAVYDEETAALRYLRPESLDDFLHRNDTAVQYSAGVLELIFLLLGHVVENIVAGVAVDSVGSDEYIRLCRRAVLEIEEQASPFFRGLVFDVHETFVEKRPPLRLKLDKRLEELGTMHRTLTGLAVRRYEDRTRQLAFRITIADSERGVSRLLFVSRINVRAKQLEGLLSVSADANTGANLAERMGGFVDLDVDMGVFAEAKRQAKASDTAADDGDAEGAVLWFVSRGRKPGRWRSDGIADFGAGMVVLRDGSHCCCCGRSSVG